MALSPKPAIDVLSERWSTFYKSRGRGYPLANLEEDRNRLRILREDWLKLLREAPACSSDWPTTKTELDQLMILLRWEPSKMWKIAREVEVTTSAQNTIGNNGPLCSKSPVTQSYQVVQGNPEEGEEFHHTTTFAYIRTFFNEMDEASMRTEELKAFAYEQSIKQIDIFYGQAANYCKILQKALQNCQNSLVASKLYDAFERDHQVLANNLNREWIIAVNGKMRELGITVPEDREDGLVGIDEVTNLELAAELLERSTETRSISTDSNTTIMENENASQASSSSTERPGSVRQMDGSDEQVVYQIESEVVEIRPRQPRPYSSSDQSKQPNPVPIHEPEIPARQEAGVQTDSDNPQRTGPILEDVGGSIKKADEDSELRHKNPLKSELDLRKAYYRTNHSGWVNKSAENDESSLTREQPPAVDAWHQGNGMADSHLSGFQSKNKSDCYTNHPGWVNKSAENDESSLTRENPPGDRPIPTSPPRYDANHLPKVEMQASANSRQTGQPRSHSSLGGAPSRGETKYAEPPGLEAQPRARSAYIETRNPHTSLSNNEIHDSHRRVNPISNVVPQEFHVQEPSLAAGHGFHKSRTQTRGVRPATREGYAVDNHEAFGMGHGNDGIRVPSTPPYPTASLKRQPLVNVSLSNETPALYATSPSQTYYGLGAETENLNHSTESYSRQSEPGRPTKSFSAANTIRNVPLTSNTNNLPSRQEHQPHAIFPSTSARSNDSVPYAERFRPRTPAGNKIPQDPRLPHEKATNWHNNQGWPGYPVNDDQGQQFPVISIATEPHETTQDIDWKALDQMLEHMIENIYAEHAARNQAESHSQRTTGLNHLATNVAVDDQTLVLAEEGDGSLVSSDESDLTDSDGLEEEITIYNLMDHPSISPSVNINRTGPYAEDSRSGNVAMNGGSSGTRKRTVSWGKAAVYRIDPEALQQRSRTTSQGIQPRSALKK